MTEYTKPAQFGLPDRMVTQKYPGKLDDISTPHPLAAKGDKAIFGDESNLRRVRNEFGLHMALRLAMERSIISGAFSSQNGSTGHRLHTGCIPNSHALVDSLTGNDLDFGFKDILNGKLSCFFE